MNIRPRVRSLALGVLLPAVVGLGGAQVGMLLAARSSVDVGAFTVELGTAFGAPQTVVDLPPLGTLSAETHRAPLRITATLQDVRIEELVTEVRAQGFPDLATDIQQDVLSLVRPLGIRVLGVALAGAAVLSALVFRTRWRALGVAVLAALLMVGGSEVALWRTYRAEALLAPRFTGSLALAPKLIGPARTALDRIDQFRSELERIVQGAVRVYGSIEAGPAGVADEIRILHISDIHLSPLGLAFAREVASAFEVDFVIDTGDLTSFGSPGEELVLREVARFDRPYVFVRGNHDAVTLPSAMGRIPNATVLGGRSSTVSGVSVYGLGHPVFTPDKERALDDQEIADLSRGAGIRMRADLQRMSRPPAIVAVHDDRMAEAVAGDVPLVISGHFHEPSAREVDGTLFLRVGSTGGAGADVFTQEGGIPLCAQVLYFAPGTPARLLAYDLIEQSPETGSLTVQRRLASNGFAPLSRSLPASGPPVVSSRLRLPS